MCKTSQAGHLWWLCGRDLGFRHLLLISESKLVASCEDTPGNRSQLEVCFWCSSARAVVWMALDPSSRAWAPSPDGLKCTRVLKPRVLHVQNKTFDESSGSQPSNHLCPYVSMFSKTFVSKLISKIYFQRTSIIQTHNCQILIRISQPVVSCQVAITVAKSMETYLFCQFYHRKKFYKKLFKI